MITEIRKETPVSHSCDLLLLVCTSLIVIVTANVQTLWLW